MLLRAILVFITVFFSIAIGVKVSAQALFPGSAWVTGATIQNVETNTASISITAYDYSSSKYYNVGDSIQPGQSKSYLPTDIPGLPDGFSGGFIFDSLKDIRVIMSVTNRFMIGLNMGDDASPSPAAAMFQGILNPNTTIFFPLVKCNYFGKTTTFFIQNTGTGTIQAAATFKIYGINYTMTTSGINPGQMVVITPTDARYNGNPPTSGNNCLGSLTVTAPQPLAGTMLEHKTAESHPTVLQSTRAFTSSDFNLVLYAPTNKKNYYNRFTGLQVQNVSSGTIPIEGITVTYYQLLDPYCPGGTKVAKNNEPIPPGGSLTFSSEVLDNKCVASAKINSGLNIAATVNESYTTEFLNAHPDRFQESTIYSAFPAHTATTFISIPIFKENSYYKGTGLSIQNVGSVQANQVILTF